MKKIIPAINKIFASIFKIIDKIIITPLTRVIAKINSKFGRSNKGVETWLAKTTTLLFVSLGLAIIVFISVDQRMLLFSENSAEVLRKQTITYIYNEEAYVLSEVPATADITLIGRKSDLYFAKQSPIHDIVVDLSDLKPGRHRVEIKYNQPLASIEYKANPSEVTVVISPKVSETRTLSQDLLNKDALDPTLTISNVNIDNDKIVIKGTEEQLATVATVKALINVKDLAKQEVGIQTLKDIPLKAYDDKGNIVNIEIVPNKVNAEIEIKSPSKELPIKIIPKGSLAFGYAISTIDANETKVTAYGSQEVLDKLSFISVEVNVDGLKDNKQYKIEIKKPSGIKTLSVNNITVNVALGKSIDREISNVGISWRNLSDSLVAQGAGANDVSVTVVLKGVKEVVDKINPEDIIAYVDLKGYGEGTFEVPVNVEGTDVRIGYLAKTKKVTIKIHKK